MIEYLKPYPTYKDSDVPWLDQIPKHWEVLPFKRYFRVAMGQTILASDIQDNGKYPVFSATEGNVYFGRISSPRFVLLPGDLVIPARGVSIGSVKLVFEPCVCTQTTIYAKKMAGANIDSKYVFYYLYGCRRWLFEYDRTAIPQLTVDQVRNNQLLVPPLPEQTAIIRFLDYMDRRIRRVIGARQRRIKLLEEYKQALIHQAVTGQIDVRTGKPYPAYKDSGVPWLGKVPEHWEVRRIGSVMKILNGATPSTSRAEFWDGDIVWITPDDLGKIKGKYIEDSSRHITLSGYNSCGTKLAPVGSIILSTRAPIGYLGMLRVSACVNQGCKILVPQDEVKSDFVYTILLMLRPYLEILGQGSTFAELSRSKLFSFSILVPPLPEQTAIIDYIDAQTAKIDTITAASRREIGLLREYRERLIADVVTGKVDVREVAAKLPEEPPEEIELMDEDELAESKEENREEGDDLTEEISEEDDR